MNDGQARGHVFGGWVAGRAGLLVALPVAWWTLSLLRAENPWCFMDYVNLAFHEAGHIFFTPLGTTIHYLGGTLGQLIVPGGLIAWFLLRERRPLAASFCCWWLGENLINVARYMADARDLELPLVGGGDHDWNELFYMFDMLTEPAVGRAATVTRGIGVLVMLAGLGWMVSIALRGDRAGGADQPEAMIPARRSL